MSQSVTVGSSAQIVVVLVDGSNTPVEGLAYTDVSVAFKKQSETSFTVKTLINSDWLEVGSGVYTILFSGTELSEIGSFVVKVTGSSIAQYVDVVNVVASSTSVTPISLDTCTLTGYVLDILGAPVEHAAVVARVVGQPVILGNTVALTDDLVTAYTDAAGEFFLSLVRLATVDISIAAVNYRRILVVPNTASALLFQIP